MRKYGGSSVQDLGRLRRIADELSRLSQAGHPLVVVVSAMGKTTSELIALAEQAANAGGSNEVPRRELDMLVSTGERVSMSLLSIILQGLGRRAVSFTGSQSGIITTDTHFDARIEEVRPHRLQRALDEGRIAVVAGYQGMSRQGEITTLGRGGSDTTAVALAGALGAAVAEIYSDVDGVYTSDPHRVSEAVHLPWIGYEFMGAMADAGARVLNREAVRLAQKSGTKIVARSSFPDAQAPRETWVTSDAQAPPCRAVVELVDAEPGQSLVSLVGSLAGDLDAARALFANHGESAFVRAGRVSALMPSDHARALVPLLHQQWIPAPSAPSPHADSAAPSTLLNTVTSC